MSEEITIHANVLRQWMRDPNGPLAKACADAAFFTVIDDVRNSIGEEATFVIDERGRTVWDPNPPIGPPKVRSGVMWRSVWVGRANVDVHGVNVPVTVDAVTTGGFNYGEELLNTRGYHFVNQFGGKYKFGPPQMGGNP